jgi:hypothetical protein
MVTGVSGQHAASIYSLRMPSSLKTDTAGFVEGYQPNNVWHCIVTDATTHCVA